MNTQHLTTKDIGRQIAIRLALVVLNCLFIGWATATFVFRGSLFIPSVYSLSIGVTSYLLIEVFVYVWRRLGKPTFNGHWPKDYGGPLATGLGCAIGFFVGLGMADRIVGLSSWQDGRHLLFSALLTAIASAAISYFFVSRGKAQGMEQELKNADAAANEARLRLLESQLNPHMLFNTLANVRALIPSDPTGAQQMLDQLNRYLRASLNSSRIEFHTVSQEIERVQDYLSILKTRFGERLNVHYDISQAAASQLIPPLLLQPLIENAVKHGIEPNTGLGTIEVRAYVENQRLDLQVSNPLPDKSPTEVLSLAEGSQVSAKYGIEHVRQRLAMSYGTKALFQRSAVNGKCVASISIVGSGQ